MVLSAAHRRCGIDESGAGEAIHRELWRGNDLATEAGTVLVKRTSVDTFVLVNYKRGRAEGRPISSAGAESAVDYVIGQRMKCNGDMRWSQRGANALLQVRCVVLNDRDVRNFVRWYPPEAQSVCASKPALAA